MAFPFRTISPVRTCIKKYQDYHQYKDFLANDFHHKCGYTDCSEKWFGGKRSFQIDHLKPKSKYPTLVNDYANLVYCCSYVNRAKSDDDNANYLDPCNVNLNNHLERDDKGFIIPKSRQGQYMVDHMQLNLYRYAIIWNLDRLTDRIEQLRCSTRPSNEVKELLNELYAEYYNYTKYLAENQ